MNFTDQDNHDSKIGQENIIWLNVWNWCTVNGNLWKGKSEAVINKFTERFVGLEKIEPLWPLNSIKTMWDGICDQHRSFLSCQHIEKMLSDSPLRTLLPADSRVTDFSLTSLMHAKKLWLMPALTIFWLTFSSD